MSTKNIIKADRLSLSHHVQPDAGAPHRAGGCSDRPGPAKPKIALHRSGDVIQAIEITCACGNTMVIECEYGEEEGT